MKRRVHNWAWIPIYFTLGIGTLGFAVPESTKADESPENVESIILFSHACTITRNLFGVQCTYLSAPTIKEFTEHGSARGYYNTEEHNVVYVKDTLDENQRRVTLVHEMAHYILHETKVVVLDKRNRTTACLSEHMSFAVSNRYAYLVLDRPDLQRVKWARGYQHCFWMLEEYIVISE